MMSDDSLVLWTYRKYTEETIFKDDIVHFDHYDIIIDIQHRYWECL